MKQRLTHELALCLIEDYAGVSIPPIRVIKEKYGCSNTTVSRARKFLMDRKWLINGVVIARIVKIDE